MVAVKNEGIILESTGLSFESKAVLNPACIDVNGIVHMFYRAVGHDNYSTIGYCQLKDNKVIKRLPYPVLVPEYDYEKQGVEDPRIVFLRGVYYLFYTAFDGRNARVAYATSSDLMKFEKHGVISPNILYNDAEAIFRKHNLKEAYLLCKADCEAIGGKDILLWDKDAFLFPRRINGKFALVHRILPDIQIAYFDNFTDLTEAYWNDYLHNLQQHILLAPQYPFEARNIGGGCPPIETLAGWLLIYHGTQETANGVTYHAAATLLNLKNPLKVIGRLNYPLFSPEETWEKTGDVDNVVFPTGAVVRNDRVYIYYGAADKLIAAKSVDLTELLTELKKTP